ncbi:MAG: F0F1 ATP synthase subunit B [Verrucomicrobiae bacterium]|nr:F0F1 ATP synthase subunit B [Verrucomicrobiae bacterium]MCP5551975.1 F0F1 ATP synthase subunit B [Akkermansiaceae bacterium]
MKQLLDTFGVQWGSFLSQVLIVLIVYLILKKYAFGPVLAMLEERRARIADGEKNLEKIRTDLANAEARVQEMLDEANADAERLIGEARASADAVREQKTQEAINEAGNIIAKAREASKLEHERLMSELKRDFGRLVVDTTSKVTGKVLDEKDQKRINEETAAQVAI